MNRTRTGLAGLLITLLALVGVVIVTEQRADATDGTVTGSPYCIDATHWGITWTWHATNVPDNVEGDVKAITTSAGTLTNSPGVGVMAGAQVILSAWTSHAANWPGVPVHHGNYSESFSTVGIPTSVSSASVMVQYDYDNGHSGDPTGEEPRPDGCTPPTETPTPTPTPSDTPTPTPTVPPTPTEPPTSTPPTEPPPTNPPPTNPPRDCRENPVTCKPPHHKPPAHKPPSRTSTRCLGNALVTKTEVYQHGEWITAASSTIEGARRCAPGPDEPPVEEEGY